MSIYNNTISNILLRIRIMFLFYFIIIKHYNHYIKLKNIIPTIKFNKKHTVKNYIVYIIIMNIHIVCRSAQKPSDLKTFGNIVILI